MTRRIAVIGAGVAGLSCARALRRAGCYVDIFEQEKIIGGRMATTRVGLTAFDHGPQYITARSPNFQKYLDELVSTGYAARWLPKAGNNSEGGAGQMSPWFVGTPGMSSLVRPMAESIRLNTGRKVHTLDRTEKGWNLWFEDETSVGPFHAVAVAVPAKQAQLLLGRMDDLAEPLSRVRMSPVWSVMVRLDERILPPQDVFSDMSEVIRWVARNNSKPGRPPCRGEQLVIHASPKWSREYEDADAEAVAEELWAEVSHALDLPPTRPTQVSAHLWKHGLVDVSLGETYMFSSQHRVGVAGDWCSGRLAEHAFDSGARLGKAIVEALSN